MALERFIRIADSLVEFEAAFNDNQLPVTSVFSIETHKDELKSIWTKLKATYEVCLSTIVRSDNDEDADDGDVAGEIETIKEKYKSSYITYCRCISKLSELGQDFLPKPSTSSVNREHNFALPPCEINIFNGDYASWPTFRDLFTAVCVKNTRLSPIEKLFHLSQKTKGEAHDIVSKSPLTNEGFSSAWSNLCARYENKRVLVNLQLKTLFNLQSVTTESGSSIKKLQRDINSCISSLQLYDIEVNCWDPIFVYICSNRLPDSTLTLWEQTLADKCTIPKWLQLDSFLTNRYRTLESVYELRNDSKSPDSKPKNQAKGKGISNGVHTYQANVSQSNCHLCPNDTHIIRKCPKFLNMEPSQRFSEIKKRNLCINCFSAAHSVRNCKSKHNCFKCNKRHHTLLHKESEGSVSTPQNSSFSNTRINSNFQSDSPLFIPQQTSTSLQSTSTTNSNVQSFHSANSRGVLLGTAMVNICHAGFVYKARALLDSGSEGTFISEKLFNRLKLPFQRTMAKISGLNNSISAEVQKECKFTLGSTIDDKVKISSTALVVPKLSGNLPSRAIDLESIFNLPKIQLADPEFYKSSTIDILIGGDLFPSIMLPGFDTGICGSLMAQKTVFGWILTGPIPSESSSSFSAVVSFHCEISLDKEISRFWEVEDFPRKTFMSENDRICEDLYKRTTKRNEDGRYIVSLPFKVESTDKINLGQSKNSAMAQYFRNEGRLIRNPKLKEEYDKVVQEYCTLGHMSPITPSKSSNLSLHYYLPHHAVIKPESITTKLRVVFNASSPTSNGQSLNDVLHSGPVLQNDLTLLILKWRFFRYVFNCDLQKMYRQILVCPEHRPFQRILYRTNPTAPLQDFELNTVTFGINCAPYLAIRTLMQLADDIQQKYPLASHILREYMYVDDVLAGAHNIETAVSARNELIRALESAGFSARKWTANSRSILANLPLDHLLSEDFLTLEDNSSAKTLGIRWNARSDCFYFAMAPFQNSTVYTKRAVISIIAKLFDPAGWLAPIVVVAKIIMQRVWVDKTGWDDQLVDETLNLWKQFMYNYHHINTIQIQRWIDFTATSDVQIHGFCDASEKAYAAAIYIRISTSTSIKTHLLLAKTRVAPIKTQSIPRLELCGALLLTDMINSLLPQLEVSNYSLSCWTDSTIVLSWLAKPPCTWTTFVANRISKIIQITDPTKWKHVKSDENPADLGSRGAFPQELENNELWWHGPKWLSEPAVDPRQAPNIAIEETDLDRKPIKVHFSYFSNFEDLLERFSSFSRAMRVMAYVFRFIYSTNPRHRPNYRHQTTNISTSEILIVRNRLIVTTQKAKFSKEYLSLSMGKSILNCSPLLSLNPFLDAEGVMRICGRLEYSSALSYDERHPILVPYNCQFSRLLIRFIHHISLHGGNQLVLRLVRTNYWIPKVQNLIKTTIHNCKPCVLYKKKCQKQLMSALPPERADISRPFTNTGLDFAGPFDIKTYSGRACRITKGYVCIFVCFSTKAIHLEATSDLSTSTFLAAFSRFVSRRGCPLHLHSDNGQTFVGASKKLSKEFAATSTQAVLSNYAHQNLCWHFIPPGAPHMGGLWEAGVKSFKQHFRKIAGASKYTFEEFQTLLSRIEACLNSRPISPISENPSDIAALTPGHFLIGSPILIPIDPSLHEVPISMCNRWQKLKVIHQNFCTRWKNEYLKELHKRNKWKKPEDDVHENMLVVIKDENLPPNCWRLGRIQKVFPGHDKRVRIAEVVTQKGTLLRPVTKLVVLPSE